MKCLFWLLLAGWAWAEGSLATGEQLVKEQQWDAALAEYKSVLDTQPDSAQAYFQIGWIYNEQKKFDSAVRWLKQGVAKHPEDGGLQDELGFACYKLGSADAAVQAYTAASRVAPASASAWKGLGDTLFELRHNSKAAAAAYAHAAELSPDDAMLHYRLGWCYNDSGKFALAEPELARATVLQPDSPAAWVELGFAQLSLKHYAPARDTLLHACSLKNDAALTHVYLGRAYLGLKDARGAREQCAVARSLDAKAARPLQEEVDAAFPKTKG